MLANIKLNKVGPLVHPYNMDGRDFLRAMAVEFNPARVGQAPKVCMYHASLLGL